MDAYPFSCPFNHGVHQPIPTGVTFLSWASDQITNSAPPDARVIAEYRCAMCGAILFPAGGG